MGISRSDVVLGDVRLDADGIACCFSTEKEGGLRGLCMAKFSCEGEGEGEGEGLQVKVKV
jgi:hypothetical protein